MNLEREGKDVIEQLGGEEGERRGIAGNVGSDEEEWIEKGKGWWE